MPVGPKNNPKLTTEVCIKVKHNSSHIIPGKLVLPLDKSGPLKLPVKICFVTILKSSYNFRSVCQTIVYKNCYITCRILASVNNFLNRARLQDTPVDHIGMTGTKSINSAQVFQITFSEKAKTS